MSTITGAKKIAQHVGMTPGAFRMMISRDRENAPIWHVFSPHSGIYTMAADPDKILEYVRTRKGESK